MVLSHSLKYVYFAVPKTASTSVVSLLVDKYEGERHGDWHNVVAPVECCGYYKFCTVRHPYTRAISLYFHILGSDKHRCHDFVRKCSFLSFMQWMIDLSMDPKIERGTGDLRHQSIIKFSREFMKQSVNYKFGRDLNQVEFLCYAFGANYMDKLDYVIRMEDIESEFNKLPFVKSHTTIPHKRSNEKSALWRTVIQKESEELIYQWARDDFAAFNYERGEF